VTLAVGVAWVLLRGELAWASVHLELARPVFTAPVFSLSATISLAVPLFIVTMASQNLPGVAVIRATGYKSRSRASSRSRAWPPWCSHRSARTRST